MLVPVWSIWQKLHFAAGRARYWTPKAPVMCVLPDAGSASAVSWVMEACGDARHHNRVAFALIRCTDRTPTGMDYPDQAFRRADMRTKRS